MISKNLKNLVHVFIALLVLAGITTAQEKNENNDSQNMNMNYTQTNNSKMMHKTDSSSFDLNAIDKNNDGMVYQCPMDFDKLSDNPGECPKCGMNLKKVSIEKASENLVKKGYNVIPVNNENSILREGEIDLSEIDANNDGKVYQDMMDYNVISDKPGTCPLCGMTLKEVSLDKAKMYLEKTGHKVKKLPGKLTNDGEKK